MKKTLLVLGLVTLTTNFVFASIDTNLKYNQNNQEVYELQDFLNDQGFLTVAPTGYFGLLTLKAVKAYQVSQNLPSTGFVGPMTREKINAVLDQVAQEATQAEVAETGTSTVPTVQSPIQPPSQPITPQFGNIQAPVQTPVQTMPAPTCTLDVSVVTISGSPMAQVTWTSTDSTGGVLHIERVGKMPSDLNLTTSTGTVASLQILDLTGRTPEDLQGTNEHNIFTATFYGAGGKAACVATK